MMEAEDRNTVKKAKFAEFEDTHLRTNKYKYIFLLSMTHASYKTLSLN